MSKPKKFPTADELSSNMQGLFDVLNKEQEVPSAIIGGAYLDHCLAALLQAFLVDGDTASALLQPGGALGDNFSRASMAYALGLISADYMTEIKKLGHIRNLFAHHLFERRFSDQEITKLCSELTIGLVPIPEKFAKTLPPLIPRVRFLQCLVTVVYYLLIKARGVKHMEKSQDKFRCEYVSDEEPPYTP